MKLLDFLLAGRRSNSAATAKERLQVVLALERAHGNGYDFLPALQQELIDVIRKYIEIDNNRVSVELERGQDMSLLEVNIELPTGAAPKLPAAG